MQNGEEMARWIHSAIRLSIASGSLFLCEDTVFWARQFDGGSPFAQKLLSVNTLLSCESLDILSGIYRPLLAHSPSSSQLRENVERADRVLMQYVNMLVLCYESTSIFTHGELDVSLLPSNVIQRRQERLHAFKMGIRLSDDEIYNSVWKPSICMLLDVERLLLKLGDRYPSLNNVWGPLRHLSLPTNPDLHVRKFLDVLGESRDKLWREYRMETYPIVRGLEAPWPKGLPIQDLVPCKFLAWKDMPYVESRAEAVLFAPRKIMRSLIPMGAEERAAIGPFVDDFIFALHVFVSAVDEGPERESRILQAWNHAVANFTDERMSKKHAVWYWRYFFSLVRNIKLPHLIASLFQVSDLELSEHDRSGITIEWGPNLKHVQFSRMSTMVELPGKLPKSCLDCMLMVHRIGSSENVRSPFVTTQVPSMSSIWDVWSSGGSIPSGEADCMVATTVAFLDAVYGSNLSLFEQPFPSENDNRFPDLRLDENFLKDEGSLAKTSSVLQILKRLEPCIPLLLSQGLARSIWKRLYAGGKKDSEILKAAVGAAKILSQGDNPDAANEFIIRGILKYQDDKL
ncbi:uncharacterized protein F4807DRAFT_156078 [Annulohypoxylon truncatum]|uniref:uncharacterized protein n=1 Tax=Annulohypoxylon truncatum TaxID=327061 RepID=UPI0020080FD7|nr:uncharacterized protein F4807DRAFT_156078 [Annulohypoxylon truncatum]KAI1208203.1 hypothetical protein F4807DRAFT_156078 [Annulohypoxylon truncatum]